MQAYRVQKPARRHGDLHLGLQGLEGLFRPAHRLLWSVGPQILLLSFLETVFVIFGPMVRHFVLARFVEVHYHGLCDFQILCLLSALSVNEAVQLMGQWAQYHLVVPAALEEAGRWSIGLWDWIGLDGLRGPSHGVYVLNEWMMGLMEPMVQSELPWSWT